MKSWLIARITPHFAQSVTLKANLYQPSPRRFDGILRAPDYPTEAVVRKVRSSGEIKWKGKYLFVSEVLAGEAIGLTEIGDDVWLVKYRPIVLGTIKGGHA